MKLTNTENEILVLLKQGYTPKKIAYRRQTTLRATQKIIQKLKGKGVILGSSCKGFVFHTTSEPLEKDLKSYRLHGQEFNLKIKFASEDYYKHKKSFYLDKNKIRLYKGSIEVYSGHNFLGDSTDQAFIKSYNYFKRFFFILQQEVGILIRNVRLVVSHYSEGNNELAEDNNKNNKKFVIRAKEDNKIWAKTDLSLNEPEFETIHPKSAKKDMDKVIKHFQDMRDNNPPTNTELLNFIFGVAKNQEMFNKNIEKHMRVLDDMSKTMKAIQKNLKK